MFLKRSTKKPKLSIHKKMSNDYETIASCYHESTHTIIALYNFIYVDEVSITLSNGGDTYYSMCQVDEINNTGLKKIMLMSELYTIYSGVIGEKIYYQHICGQSKLPMFLRYGSYADTAYGSEIIRKYQLALPGKDTFNFKKKIKLDLEKVISYLWEDVKLLSHLLYKKKRLSFLEIRNLLIKSSKNNIIWKDIYSVIDIIYDEDKLLSDAELKKLIIANKSGKP